MKVIPSRCYLGQVPQKFHRYNIIDKVSRERFIYPFKEHNRFEFTHFRKTKMIHPPDVLCNKLNIQHKLIRARTPRHNGEVERSNRNDVNRFYNHLSFFDFNDLLVQMKRYLYKSNIFLMQTLA